MLKTRWRKFKSPVLKPILRVEFHTFHRVFHIPVRPVCFSCVQFVKYKSEIWQFFELHSVRFCQIFQYHFDECGSMLKIRPFAAFPPRGFMLQILWNIVVFCSVLTLSDGKFPSPQGSIFRIVAGKKPVWIDFRRCLGYTNSVSSLRRAQSRHETSKAPMILWR